MERKIIIFKNCLAVLVVFIINIVGTSEGIAQDSPVSRVHIAPAPLYRDPVTDGAADPVIIWNRQEKSWWMLYTQRRANLDAADVAYCYGTPIGIASSKDNGQTWVYRGTLKLDFDR